MTHLSIFHAYTLVPQSMEAAEKVLFYIPSTRQRETPTDICEALLSSGQLTMRITTRKSIFLNLSHHLLNLRFMTPISEVGSSLTGPSLRKHDFTCRHIKAWWAGQ
jgi:hypothetical protein